MNEKTLIENTLLFKGNYKKMYICWYAMCRFSRRVQDPYCSVQNVPRQASLVQRCCEPKFCTQRAAGEPSTKLKARSEKPHDRPTDLFLHPDWKSDVKK